MNVPVVIQRRFLKRTIGAPILGALVVLAPGFRGSSDMVSDLQDHVKRVTAPYKYPREIEFVDELPKTISGKIRRNELRNRESRHS